MKLSGTEILIRSFANLGIDTIFGYPGACVVSILDFLYDNKDVKHILVRHEQGAVHAACGYAKLANKPGVVIVTSGPGATNTITGIADAYYSEIPLVVITGQVSSELIGTDAFQEMDMVSVTASITKWNCQIRHANEMADSVSKAFAIATAERPGPVLLDITKDAQTSKSEYIINKIKVDYNRYSPTDELVIAHKLPENKIYEEIRDAFKSSGKDIVLVVDKIPNDFYTDESFCSNKVIRSEIYNVPGFGLPAAIGAKYANPDKTICLIAGSMEFQATIKELGVIKQQGIDIKMILLNNTTNIDTGNRNPDFMRIINAYTITGEKINQNSHLSHAIHKMLNTKESYLLEISQ